MTLLLADAASDLVGYLLTAISVMAATVGALFFIREKERGQWFEKMTAATTALNENADAIEKLSERLDALSKEVATLNAEIVRMREAAAK